MKNAATTLFFTALCVLAFGVIKSAAIYQPLENLTGDRANNLPIQVAIALFAASIAAHLIWGERRT